MTEDHRTHRTAAPAGAAADAVGDDIPFDDEFDPEADRLARERMVAHLRLLWERRGFVCRVTACGAAIAVMLALAIPKRYESTARLMPPESQSNAAAAALASMSGGAALTALAGDLLGVNGTGAIFVGVLGSRTVRDRLIERFDLANVYGTTRPEDTREKLADHTSVSEDRKSGIVSITVEDRDPARAAALASAYVAELDRLVVTLTTSEASRERAFLEERLRSVKEELDAAAKEFSEFSSEHATLDIRDQGRAMVDAAAALQGQLIASQTQLEGLRQIYADNNVRVRSLQASIDEWRSQLERMGGANGAPGAEESTEGLLYPSLRELPLLAVTYADLYRRTRVQETVFELLTQQYELAKVQEAKEIPSVKVLDEPVIPEKKSFPPRTLIVLVGTLLSLVAGAGWVVGRARWDEIDRGSPARQLAEEVFATLQTDVSRFASRACGLALWNSNGNGHHPSSPDLIAAAASATESGRLSGGEPAAATGFSHPGDERSSLTEVTHA